MSIPRSIRSPTMLLVSHSTSWCANSATGAAPSIRSCSVTEGIAMTAEPAIRLRAIPSVDDVLKEEAVTLAIARFGRPAAVKAVRQALQAARDALRAGKPQSSRPEAIASTALATLAAEARSNLRPVFNLTGTVLHTNLGRALLAEAAIEAAVAAMRSAVALEFDLATGKRGERDDHLRGLLREFSG